MTSTVLRERICAQGWPAYRAEQVQSWLQNGVTDFSGMTNLPPTMREALAKSFVIPHVEIQKKLVSKNDSTIKYLYALADGETVESVLMEYKHGWSQCLSTQVGCRMGCHFCATGMGGWIRNLLPSEMMAQIEAAQKEAGIRVSSVVLMGMGEPLDNYVHVLRFLRMLGEPGGVNIGLRHVSLSTCGLVDGIERLRGEQMPLTLSVSLHAPNNRIRSELMPINRRYPIEMLLQACREYGKATGRRISFEYAMFRDVNDSDDNARELAARLRGILCHVNLIPASPVEGKTHTSSTKTRLHSFLSVLEKSGVQVTVRRTLGADIEASCGQLRRASI